MRESVESVKQLGNSEENVIQTGLSDRFQSYSSISLCISHIFLLNSWIIRINNSTVLDNRLQFLDADINEAIMKCHFLCFVLFFPQSAPCPQMELIYSIKSADSLLQRTACVAGWGWQAENSRIQPNNKHRHVSK